MPLFPRCIRKRRLRWPFWVSTVISSAMVLTLVGSYWWVAGGAFRVSHTAHSLELADSSLRYTLYEGPDVPEMDADRFRFKMNWNANPRLPRWRPAYFSIPASPTSRVLGIDLPVHVIALPFVLFSTIYFMRAPLKHGKEQCKHCGYDTRGIKDGTCPECGKETPHPSAD